MLATATIGGAHKPPGPKQYNFKAVTLKQFNLVFNKPRAGSEKRKNYFQPSQNIYKVDEKYMILQCKG